MFCEVFILAIAPQHNLIVYLPITYANTNTQRRFDMTNNSFNSASNNSGLVRIETPRLILRDFVPKDVDHIYKMTQHPDFFYHCFDGSYEKAKTFVDHAIKMQKPDPKTGKREDYLLAVVRKDTGELVGHAGADRVPYGNPEYQKKIKFDDGVTDEQKRLLGVSTHQIKYFIDCNHQGGGIGSEALINIADFAYKHIGVESICSTQHPDNEIALHNARKKIGFVPLGITTMKTTKGNDPRIVHIVTPDQFYACRKHDKFSMLKPDN